MAGTIHFQKLADPGRPVQLATIDPANSSKFIWDQKLVEEIFKNNAIANLPVAIISIVGAYRKGKSFLLSFFHMFLRALNESGNKPVLTDWSQFEWLTEDKMVEGFEWKSGTNRVTTGIWTWEKPIVIHARNGKKMAVVLLDTQGAFDHISPINEFKNIFGLSAGLSSVLIYNVSQDFDEEKIQHLCLFAECFQTFYKARNGEEMQNESSEKIKPFQKLLVVVRDHQNDEQYEMGKAGGTKLVEDALGEQSKSKSNQNPEAAIVRKYLNETFERIEGFTLPRPGIERQSTKFNGEVHKIDREFKDLVKKLVIDTMLFAMLEPKTINGQPITCSFIPQIFEHFVHGCEQQEIVQGMFTAIENVKCSRICENMLVYYREEMDSKLLRDYKKAEEPKRILQNALGFALSTISYIEGCIPSLMTTHNVTSSVKLGGNVVGIGAAIGTTILLFTPVGWGVALAIGGAALGTQLATRAGSWIAMDHAKDTRMNRINQVRTEIEKELERLEEIEKGIERVTDEKESTFAEGARLVSKTTFGALHTAAIAAPPTVAAVAAKVGGEVAVELLPMIGKIAKGGGAALAGVGILIDAYDSYALIRDFNEPTELVKHLETTVLVQFHKAKISIMERLTNKYKVIMTPSIMGKRKEDMTRRETFSSPLTPLNKNVYDISRKRSKSTPPALMIEFNDWSYSSLCIC